VVPKQPASSPAHSARSVFVSIPEDDPGSSRFVRTFHPTPGHIEMNIAYVQANLSPSRTVHDRVARSRARSWDPSWDTPKPPPGGDESQGFLSSTSAHRCASPVLSFGTGETALILGEEFR
jgi:hypothetical protein